MSGPAAVLVLLPKGALHPQVDARYAETSVVQSERARGERQRQHYSFWSARVANVEVFGHRLAKPGLGFGAADEPGRLGRARRRLRAVLGGGGALPCLLVAALLDDWRGGGSRPRRGAVDALAQAEELHGLSPRLGRLEVHCALLEEVVAVRDVEEEGRAHDDDRDDASWNRDDPAREGNRHKQNWRFLQHLLFFLGR